MSGAEEGWIGAGKGTGAATVAKVAAQVARIGAKRERNAADRTGGREMWASIAAGKGKAPAITG